MTVAWRGEVGRRAASGRKREGRKRAGTVQIPSVQLSGDDPYRENCEPGRARTLMCSKLVVDLNASWFQYSSRHHLFRRG